MTDMKTQAETWGLSAQHQALIRLVVAQFQKSHPPKFQEQIAQYVRAS